MVSDDGFGPVERGGGRSGGRVGGRSGGRSGAAAAPPAPPAPPRRPEPPPDDGFGPVQRGRGLPGRGLLSGGRTRVLLTAGVVLVLAGVGIAAVLALYTSMQITREDVGGLQAADTMNVLIIGSDSREGLTEEELQGLGTEAVGGDRTDTIFLLSTSGGRAAMLSFPRDLFVTRCDGSQGRINAAYGLGGPTCMVQTVTQTSGIPVTHYAEINFLGFINIVDAVSGVTIHLDEPFVDRPAGVDLPAGCHDLDGRQAIGYVRARTVDGDLGRIARQQRFLGELAEEITRPTTLLNVPRLFATAGAAGRSLTASQNLGTLDLLRLARAGRGFAGSGLATYTVPGTVGRVQGASVIVPDQAAAAELYAQFRDGSILDPAEPEADAPPSGEAPADAPVDAPADPAPAPPEDAAGTGPVPADC